METGTRQPFAPMSAASAWSSASFIRGKALGGRMGPQPATVDQVVVVRGLGHGRTSLHGAKLHGS